MVNNDFIIEVKTTWIKTEDLYERNIIEYRLDGDLELDNIAYSTKYLKKSNITTEYAKNIDKNTFEFNVKSIISGCYKDNLNDLESLLLRYTKNQWELF